MESIRSSMRVGCGWGPELFLLGHSDGDITTHCSAAEIEELRQAAQRIVNPRVVQAPTLMTVRRTRTGVGKVSANEEELARNAV